MSAPLSPAAAALLRKVLGDGSRALDATLEEVIARVPPPRLPGNPLLSTDPAQRVRHARGKSLPDWVALRSGQIETFPDGVATPESEGEVRALMDYARQAGVHLIAYGGGTSVVGHITPLPGGSTGPDGGSQTLEPPAEFR
jgi:alkyldihydroxyacetonephosphate synthase